MHIKNVLNQQYFQYIKYVTVELKWGLGSDVISETLLQSVSWTNNNRHELAVFHCLIHRQQIINKNVYKLKNLRKQKTKLNKTNSSNFTQSVSTI